MLEINKKKIIKKEGNFTMRQRDDKEIWNEILLTINQLYNLEEKKKRNRMKKFQLSLEKRERRYCWNKMKITDICVRFEEWK